MMFSTWFVQAIFCLCQVAIAIKLDAAYYDTSKNQTYFYHDDRYFIFDVFNILTEDGPIKQLMPWMPTPIEAAYQASGDTKAFVKSGYSYLVNGGRLQKLEKNIDIPYLSTFSTNPDAVASIHNSDVSLFFTFKNDKYYATHFAPSDLSNVKKANGTIAGQFPGLPAPIDAAFFLDIHLFTIVGELLWKWGNHLALMNGYPKEYKDVFKGEDNTPSFFTTLRYTSKRLDGYVINHVKVDSLNDCFKICLNLPFLTCSSINYEKIGTSSKHRCEINKFKERHFPENFKYNEGFVYYDVNWYFS